MPWRRFDGGVVLFSFHSSRILGVGAAPERGTAVCRQGGAPMSRVAVATSSQIAADAGAWAAEQGGSAVDAAIAACLASLVTEPGVVSPAAGAFVTVWPENGDPVTIDGAAEMPGRAATPERFGCGGLDVQLSYGGGMKTTVGYGSVATPGCIAGLALAHERFGRLPWKLLFDPALGHARDGFPLSQASYNYLVHTHDGIFGWNPDSFEALHDNHGRLKEAGMPVKVRHLADSLEAVANHGAGTFYGGELGRRMADHVFEHGGLLSHDDMSAYQPIVRPALTADEDDWRVASAPAPSMGGAALTAMLKLMRGHPEGGWSAREVAVLVEVQSTVLQFRQAFLDQADDLGFETSRLLTAIDRGELAKMMQSPSTVHTSSVDADGLACSITASAGYGSGIMPPETGIWLNNCLGEVELNKHGFHALDPGMRLPSNMAPTVARRGDGAVIAIGSPGADRITTAILQTIVNFVHVGMSLEDAVAHPRLHVESVDGASRVAYEPGLDMGETGLPVRGFDELNMFFGGVAAVLRDPVRGFVTAADPRRTGGTAVAG